MAPILSAGVFPFREQAMILPCSVPIRNLPPAPVYSIEVPPMRAPSAVLSSSHRPSTGSANFRTSHHKTCADARPSTSYKSDVSRYERRRLARIHCRPSICHVFCFCVGSVGCVGQSTTRALLCDQQRVQSHLAVSRSRHAFERRLSSEPCQSIYPATVVCARRLC